MASPTFLELQQRVQARDYGSADLTTIKLVLNEAYEEVMADARWPFALTSTSVSSTAGTATISITATDVQELSRLRAVTLNKLTPQFVDFNTPDSLLFTQQSINTTERGTPQFYTFRDYSTIELYPVPDATYSYTLYYWKAPTLMVADADTPLIPPAEREVLVHGALSRMCTRDRDFSGAAYHDQMFQRTLAKMRGKYLHANGSARATRAVMPEHYNWEYGV